MLGKKALDQQATHQQKVDIEQSIDEIYADLQTDRLLTWSTTGSVPNDVLPHVKALVAFNRADGLSVERYSRILSKASIAKREIKKIVSPEHDSVDNPTDF